jgi:hypothetical protein
MASEQEVVNSHTGNAVLLLTQSFFAAVDANEHKRALKNARDLRDAQLHCIRSSNCEGIDVERPTGIPALDPSRRPRHRDQHGCHRVATLLRNVSLTANTVFVIVGTLSQLRM